MGSRNEPSRRLYVGRLPPDANRLEVVSATAIDASDSGSLGNLGTLPQEDFFSSTGIKPVEVKLLSGYGFIEFDSVAVSPLKSCLVLCCQLSDFASLPHSRTQKTPCATLMARTSWETGELMLSSSNCSCRVLNDKINKSARLLVQFAKSGGERTRRYDDREPPRGGDRGYDRGGPREKPAQGWRLTISNLPQGCSWQVR